MRRISALSAVVGAVALLGACGGGGGSASPEVASLGTDPVRSEAPDSSEAPAASAPTDPEEAILAYTQCMRDHGIDMPDPQIGVGGDGGDFGVAVEGDGDDEEFAAAEAECAPLLEAAMGDFEVDPEQEEEMRQEMLAYAECMRDQGFDMPDPVFGDDGGVSIDADSVEDAPDHDDFDPEDEEFIAASEECGVGAEVNTERLDASEEN